MEKFPPDGYVLAPEVAANLDCTLQQAKIKLLRGEIRGRIDAHGFYLFDAAHVRQLARQHAAMEEKLSAISWRWPRAGNKLNVT